MASSEADKTGASVAPGKNHHSRVRVDRANVSPDGIKNKKTNPNKAAELEISAGMPF